MSRDIPQRKFWLARLVLIIIAIAVISGIAIILTRPLPETAFNAEFTIIALQIGLTVLALAIFATALFGILYVLLIPRNPKLVAILSYFSTCAFIAGFAFTPLLEILIRQIICFFNESRCNENISSSLEPIFSSPVLLTGVIIIPMTIALRFFLKYVGDTNQFDDEIDSKTALIYREVVEYCEKLPLTLPGSLFKEAEEEHMVPLQAEVEKGGRYTAGLKNVSDFISTIQTDKTSEIFFISGDAGSGKSLSLKKLVRELCDKAKDNPETSYIPIYVNLQDCPEDAQNKDEFGQKYQYVKGKIGERFDDWDEVLRRTGRWILILDSFDELSKLPEEYIDAKNLFDQFIKLFRTNFNGCKLVMVSRNSNLYAEYDIESVTNIRILPLNRLNVREMLSTGLSKYFIQEQVNKYVGKIDLDALPFITNPLIVKLVIEYIASAKHNQQIGGIFQIFNKVIRNRLRSVCQTSDRVEATIEFASLIAYKDSPSNRADNLTKDPDLKHTKILIEAGFLRRMREQTDEENLFSHSLVKDFFAVNYIIENIDETREYLENKIDSISYNSLWRNRLLMCYGMPGLNRITRGIDEYFLSIIMGDSYPSSWHNSGLRIYKRDSQQIQKVKYSLEFISHIPRQKSFNNYLSIYIDKLSIALAQDFYYSIRRNNRVAKMILESLPLLNEGDQETVITSALYIHDDIIFLEQLVFFLDFKSQNEESAGDNDLSRSIDVSLRRYLRLRGASDPDGKKSNMVDFIANFKKTNKVLQVSKDLKHHIVKRWLDIIFFIFSSSGIFLYLMWILWKAIFSRNYTVIIMVIIFDLIAAAATSSSSSNNKYRNKFAEYFLNLYVFLFSLTISLTIIYLFLASSSVILLFSEGNLSIEGLSKLPIFKYFHIATYSLLHFLFFISLLFIYQAGWEKSLELSKTFVTSCFSKIVGSFKHFYINHKITSQFLMASLFSCLLVIIIPGDIVIFSWNSILSIIRLLVIIFFAPFVIVCSLFLFVEAWTPRLENIFKVFSFFLSRTGSSSNRFFVFEQKHDLLFKVTRNRWREFGIQPDDIRKDLLLLKGWKWVNNLKEYMSKSAIFRDVFWLLKDKLAANDLGLSEYSQRRYLMLIKDLFESPAYRMHPESDPIDEFINGLDESDISKKITKDLKSFLREKPNGDRNSY